MFSNRALRASLLCVFCIFPLSRVLAENDDPTSSLAFNIANRASSSRTTTGATATVSAGYGRIQPDTGSTTPSGLAIFGLRQSGVLVSEAAVPAAPLLQSARIYAEVNGTVNTGVAIANPGTQPVVVDFFFTDLIGATVGSGDSVLTITNGGTLCSRGL